MILRVCGDVRLINITMFNEANIKEIQSILLASLVFADNPMSVYQLKNGFASFAEGLEAVRVGDCPLGFWQQRGISENKIAALKNPTSQHLAAVEQTLKWGGHDCQHLLIMEDTGYPELLKEIDAPPPLLFIKGQFSVLSNRQMAIVGSRNPSSWGLEHAQEFAAELIAYGFTITSGLALGVDAAAHEAALMAKGSTIAVMGSGFNHIYPKANRALADNIANHGGAVLSEFPLSFAPLPRNFPQRNRIISGLCWGTLVIEANLRSGSLITARLAAEQGREVFALPGSIESPLARGCHKLIREGAKLVEDITDIIEEFTELANYPSQPHIVSKHNKNNNQDPAAFAAQKLQDLDDASKKFLAYIGYEATAVDVLLKRSNLTISQIMSMLALLELKQYVRKDVGGYIRLR